MEIPVVLDIPLTIVDLCEREHINKTIHFITSGFGVGLLMGNS